MESKWSQRQLSNPQEISEILQELLQESRAKLDLLEVLHQLCHRQGQLLTQGHVEFLGSILKDKQTTIEQIEFLDQRLNELRGQLDLPVLIEREYDLEALVQLEERCLQVVQEIGILEGESEKMVINAKQHLFDQMKNSNSERIVRRAYRSTEQNPLPRFVDRK